MRLRPVDAADLETIRVLRNRERAWFFDGREITPGAQRQWFDALAEKSIVFLVIEDEGKVVGTISLTKSVDGTEVGNLLLDPASRGRGLMRRAVAELTSGPGRYFSRVKAGNVSSERVFLASGFGCSAGSPERLFEKTVGPTTAESHASRG